LEKLPSVDFSQKNRKTRKFDWKSSLSLSLYFSFCTKSLKGIKFQFFFHQPQQLQEAAKGDAKQQSQSKIRTKEEGSEYPHRVTEFCHPRTWEIRFD